MKQLTCEMCGSTDLMKDSGMFVCQVCGCKYSLEEARKMMIEGTVEVQGTVQVANAAKATNLLKMAQSSFESKNYAKAEEFCDQALAIDDKNYEAWRLKGEAIYYQITTTNDRILEVYNCLMTAYRMFRDFYTGNDRDTRIHVVTHSLKECMENFVCFWAKQFYNDRPSESILQKIKDKYFMCRKWIDSAFQEFERDFKDSGYGNARLTYLKKFDNVFIRKCNEICVSSWKDYVAYNYFRQDLSSLGEKWNRNRNKAEYKANCAWRPPENIRNTFVEETAILISFLKFCEERINDLTSATLKKNIYSNLAYFWRTPIEQVSYKLSGDTYVVDFYLTDSSKAKRREYAVEYDRKEQAAVAQIEAEKIAEEKKRIDAYWLEHADEKSRLEQRLEAINIELDRLRNIAENYRAQIAVISEETAVVLPAESQLSELKSQHLALVKQKGKLGLFAGKEKKHLQEQIDSLQTQMAVFEDSIKSQKKAIQDDVDARITAIEAECKPYSEQICALETERSNITHELTKKR